MRRRGESKFYNSAHGLSAHPRASGSRLLDLPRPGELRDLQQSYRVVVRTGQSQTRLRCDAEAFESGRAASLP